MKFIVDAQLPKKLAIWLRSNGIDAIYTLELPLKNTTSDSDIIKLSLAESRIVITKDVDFFDTFLWKSEPHNLIYLTTGNISTNELIHLFDSNLDRIIEEISFFNVIEVNRKSIIVLD